MDLNYTIRKKSQCQLILADTKSQAKVHLVSGFFVFVEFTFSKNL